MEHPRVTQLLEAAQRGDATATDRLLPVVYQELRRLASRKLSQEAPGHTLQPTALVHEAYLRLVGTPQGAHWEGRRHFFGAAAEAMRRILVESARRRNALKRGGGGDERSPGGRVRQDVGRVEIAAPEPDASLLAVHEALEELARVDAPAAELVKLRYFAGVSGAEAAEVLGVSPRSADRLWAYAKAWLHRRLDVAD